MKRLALAAIVAVVAVGCATPEPVPQPTPQVVRVEVPGPQPTPRIITKTKIVYAVPEECIDALDLNAEAWTMEGQFLDYLLDEDTWTERDSDEFGALMDDSVAAADACWDAYDKNPEGSAA